MPMRVPLLDLKAQLTSIEKELKEAVCQVVDSGQYILGPKVEELETEVARYTWGSVRGRCLLRNGCALGVPDGARRRISGPRCYHRELGVSRG